MNASNADSKAASDPGLIRRVIATWTGVIVLACSGALSCGHRSQRCPRITSNGIGNRSRQVIDRNRAKSKPTLGAGAPQRRRLNKMLA